MGEYIIKLIGTDGLLHFSISLALSNILCALGLPSWLVFSMVVALGVSKEVYDKATGKGSAEWKDLICDIVGAIFGIL
jgi:hypothetical protein